MRRFDFSNKVVVVTGASAGIGRAAVLEFAKAGAKVAMLSRNLERLSRAKAEVEALGGQAIFFVVDVANFQEVEEAAEKIVRAWGRIDVWVNNAMVSVLSPVKEMLPQEFKRVTEVTYLGVVNGTLSALKYMLKKNEGMVVQVGSALAYRGIPLQSAYCAAKHAVKGFHDSLRAELLHDKSKVRITMVQLSAFNTPQFDWIKSRLPHKAQPVPPIFQPEVAAKAIVFAAANTRRQIIVGWPALKAIWANKFLPSYIDAFLGRTGYKSQQTQATKGQGYTDNLWSSVEKNVSSHGRFDAQAKNFSLQLWLNTHLNFTIIAVSIFLIFIFTLFYVR